MNQAVVVTLIADDKPGIIETLSKVINENHASWQESRFSHLSGKFAGILRLEVEDQYLGGLNDALAKLSDSGMQLQVEVAKDVELDGQYQEFELNVVGNDQAGIVAKISNVLNKMGANVLDLETYTEGAAWSGEPLFHVDAILLVDGNFDGNQLVEALEELSNDLMVDFNLARSY